MFKLSVFVVLILTIYHFKYNKSYTINTDDDKPTFIENPMINDHSSKDDLTIMITEYYKDLNTFIMPTEKIIPLQVFYDVDGLSFSKTIYECVEYYETYNKEIMKNTKHIKIIIVNTNDKSYCIMNTDLII